MRNEAQVAIATMEAIIKDLKDGTLIFEECGLTAHAVKTEVNPEVYESLAGNRSAIALVEAEAGEFTKTGREILTIQYVRADAPVFQVVFSKVGE